MTDQISRAEVIRIIRGIYENPAEANDNGGTRDGWEMACREIEKAVSTPKFAETFCSSCGRSFGPGDHGYSHCEAHRS
jgi:hypothetical protein